MNHCFPVCVFRRDQKFKLCKKACQKTISAVILPHVACNCGLPYMAIVATDQLLLSLILVQELLCLLKSHLTILQLSRWYTRITLSYRLCKYAG